MKNVKIIYIFLILAIAILTLASCAATADAPETSAPDREFLDKLVGGTEDTDKPYVEPDTEAISDVETDTYTDTTEKNADTTEKPVETTKKAEDTTKKPVETTKTPEETTKTPEETTKTPEETTKTPEETTKKPTETTKVPDTTTYVWIPTNGGKKYHKTSGCSNMIDPLHVSLDEAIRKGFTACKRCYK